MTRYLPRIITIILVIGWSLNTFALEGTYYSDAFEGSRTANGTVFSQKGFSAAVCDINLWQYVYAQYGNTGVVVTANDRPNCNRYPDVIDFSRSAFEVFSPIDTGRISNVSITNIGTNTGNFIKRNFAWDIFSDLGVILTQKIANTYFAWDSITLKWRVTINKKTVFLFLQEKNSNKEILKKLVSVDSSGNFIYSLQLPLEPGDFELVIAAGNSFEVKSMPVIRTIPKESLAYPSIPSTANRIYPVISGGEFPRIVFPENIWSNIAIVRDGRVFQSHGQWSISLDGIKFTPGNAQVFMSGFILSTPSSLDRSQSLPGLYSGSVRLDIIRDPVGRENVSIKTNKQIANFRFRLKPGIQIRSWYYVTLPNGDVRELDFAKGYIDTSGYLKTGVWITGSFPFRDTGTYKLEFVDSKGFAYVNIPLFQWKVWPVLPVLSEQEKLTIRKQQSTVERDSISAINRLRASLGRSLLSSDQKNLRAIAQARANYMAENDHIQHETKDGKNFMDVAIALWIKTPTRMAENIAGWNVSDIFLQQGLEESWSHRSNMLDPSWTKVGIGYAIKNGKVYMVQIFGE